MLSYKQTVLDINWPAPPKAVDGAKVSQSIKK